MSARQKTKQTNKNTNVRRNVSAALTWLDKWQFCLKLSNNGPGQFLLSNLQLLMSSEYEWGMVALFNASYL